LIKLSETQLLSDIFQKYFDEESTNYSGMYKIYSDFAPPVNEKTGSPRHDDKQADLIRFDQITEDLLKQQLENGNIVGVTKTYPTQYTEIGGIYGAKVLFTLDLFSLMDKTELQTEINGLVFESDYKNSAVSKFTTAQIPTITTGNTYYVAWGYNKPNYAVLENTGYGRRQQLTLSGSIFIAMSNTTISAGYFGDEFTLQTKYPVVAGLSSYVDFKEALSISLVEQVRVENKPINVSGQTKTKIIHNGSEHTAVVTGLFTRTSTLGEHFLKHLLADFTNMLDPYTYHLKFTLEKGITDYSTEWTNAKLLKIDTVFNLGEFVFLNITFSLSA
jgi:hypothetical protein